MSNRSFAYRLSVTEATARGVAGLLKDAEQGHEAVLTRHGKPVAAVVSVSRLEELRELESDLRDMILMLTRIAGDTGTRVDLDDVIAAFGFNRAELEAELDADLAAGRD